MAGDNDEMFMTRSLNVTPKTTEQNLNVCSDKSAAYVTNNNRLHARRFVIVKLTTDKHEVSRGLFATAKVLVLLYSGRTAERQRGPQSSVILEQCIHEPVRAK